MVKIMDIDNGDKKLSNEYIIKTLNRMNYLYKETDDVYNLMFSKKLSNLFNYTVLISFYKDDVDDTYSISLTTNAPIDYSYESDYLTTEFELNEWLRNTYNMVLNEIKESLTL